MNSKKRLDATTLKNMAELLNPTVLDCSENTKFAGLSCGKMFGHYKIEKELGRGGMGVVYKAYDSKLKTFVALKVLLQEQTAQTIQRFLREASATAQLNHANIVRFYQAGELPRPYFTMEYIEGETLASLIKERKIKSWNLVTLMIKLCDALHYAHKNNIMHRDIKPSNIMITRQGEPKIMDFGLAKITKESMQDLSQSGQILGTLLYMPPEQVSGKATYQSDIYSIGATIYEAITFRPLYQGDNQFNLMYQILDDAPIPPRRLNPDISPYLEAICLKCLQKKAKHRYKDFRQLAKELKNFKAHRAIIAKKYSKWDSINYFVQKNKVVCVAIAVVFLSLVVSTIFVFIAWKKEDEKANDLEKLTTAMVTSLKYITQTKHRALLSDHKFLNSITTVINESERLQNAKEFRSLRGLISWYKGNVTKSIAEFSRVISLNPNSVVDYENRGSLYLKQKKYKKAMLDFTTAISLNPKSVISYLNRGFLYSKQKKYQKAIDDFTKWIFLKPGFEAYQARALVYLEQKKYQKAIDDLNKAISLNPNFATAYFSRAVAHKYQKNYQKAMLDLNKVISLDPKKAAAYKDRGIIYFRQENYKKAMLDFNKAISLNPGFAEAYINRGSTYFRQQKYQKAIDNYSKAISLHPNFAQAYSNRGHAYFRQQKYQKAVKDWQKAIILGESKQKLRPWIAKANK